MNCLLLLLLSKEFYSSSFPGSTSLISNHVGHCFGCVLVLRRNSAKPADTSLPTASATEAGTEWVRLWASLIDRRCAREESDILA